MMRRFVLFSLVIVLTAGICGVALAVDVYDTIKERGVLIGGVKDSTPGFGYIDRRPARLLDTMSIFSKRLQTAWE